MSRLKQLTGRLSFNFDSSKRMSLDETAGRVHGSSQQKEISSRKASSLRYPSNSTNVSSGSTTAGGVKQSKPGYCCIKIPQSNNPIKPISPNLNQRQSLSISQRNHDLLAQMNTNRNRAYSLDVPITRNCCRSLSGSTAGGVSSCEGSHKSLTFSLNRSLNDENDYSSERRSKNGNEGKADCTSNLSNKSGDADSENIWQQNEPIIITLSSPPSILPPFSTLAIENEPSTTSNKGHSTFCGYWLCITNRFSSLVCRCCEPKRSPVESV